MDEVIDADIEWDGMFGYAMMVQYLEFNAWVFFRSPLFDPLDRVR